jgi:hypothetical protein
MKKALFQAALLNLAIISSVDAAQVYRESVDGELSSDGTAPTLIALAAGSNQIFGRIGGGGGGTDLDYFVVDIPTSMRLTSLTLLNDTRVLGVSFIAVQSGTQVTVNPLAGSANGLLGWYHYGASDIGKDILPAMGAGFGASGFTAPLPSGSYAFWLQETGSGSVTYGLDLQVQPVPLPSALSCLALGLPVLLRGRRRKTPTD